MRYRRGAEELETRATDAWGSWIGGIRTWDVFGGLTYRQQARVGSADRLPGPRPLELVRRDVERWVSEFQRTTTRQVEAAVVAVESHRSGWPHIHPLLGLQGGLQDGDLKQLWSLWYQRHGGGKLERPRSQSDVSAYAVKYLAKDLARGDVMILPRRARTLAELGTRQLGFGNTPTGNTGCLIP